MHTAELIKKKKTIKINWKSKFSLEIVLKTIVLSAIRKQKQHFRLNMFCVGVTEV